MKKFAGLDIQNLPVEEEAELEKLAIQGPTLETDVKTTQQQPTGAQGKRKGKSRRVAAEPLDNYKVKSETKAYFAICFFVRDILNLRK